jgi:hypothetical protein
MPWGAESADRSLLVHDLAMVLERLCQGVEYADGMEVSAYSN